MNKILAKIHYVIIAWAIWNLYQANEVHKKNLKEIEDKVPIAQKKIEKEKNRKKEIENYLADIEDAKRRIKVVTSKIELSYKQIPNDKSSTVVLDYIKSIAEKINLKDIKIIPKEEKNEGLYFSRKFGIVAVGTFLQFLILFEKIAEAERILNIYSLEFNTFEYKKKGVSNLF